jgi:hypothetical protein
MKVSVLCNGSLATRRVPDAMHDKLITSLEANSLFPIKHLTQKAMSLDKALETLEKD